MGSFVVRTKAWSPTPYGSGDRRMPLTHDVLRTYMFLIPASMAVALFLFAAAQVAPIPGLASLSGSDAADFFLGGGIFVSFLGAGIVFLRRSPDDSTWFVRLVAASFFVAANTLVAPVAAGLWSGLSAVSLVSFWAALVVAGLSLRGLHSPPAAPPPRRRRAPDIDPEDAEWLAGIVGSGAASGRFSLRRRR